MSKVSFSRELLGTVRFVFDKTKSRTLNATQAYDKSSSQIVLGSFPATASKKLLAKDLGEPKQSITVGTMTANWMTGGDGVAAKIDADQSGKGFAAPIAATVNMSYVGRGDEYAEAKKDVIIEQAPAPISVIFVGSGLVAAYAAVKSKKTKEFYYGAITVGTGDYRAWQGKYAVLKFDLLTNKAILRVYNE